MAGKITKYKLTGTIASNAINIYTSHVVRGKIIAVQVDYPAHTVTVDLLTDEAVPQTILDLAAANTDVTIYPRTPVQDYTGADIDLSDAEGGNVAKYDNFCVFSRLNLVCASGTNGEVVTVHVYVEEY